MFFSFFSLTGSFCISSTSFSNPLAVRIASRCRFFFRYVPSGYVAHSGVAFVFFFSFLCRYLERYLNIFDVNGSHSDLSSYFFFLSNITYFINTFYFVFSRPVPFIIEEHLSFANESLVWRTSKCRVYRFVLSKFCRNSVFPIRHNRFAANRLSNIIEMLFL